MRLRRVAITGFKTFARRSELVLDGGVTAVVGPNGTGKSNFVDAIRWALGEGSARELRGARMDDVIYSGGRGRGRMGLAEVELTIDNEAGGLAIAEPEIALRRRVVRGGDSEYRVNGDRVRLRDVDRLLGDTGLTQSGYAVVAQNDIDGIVQATPAQRRVLVEQAAGVRPLRAACEDAGERVRRAGLTIARLEDLLGEIEPRLAELEGQAALALEQREMTERLASLRGNLAREAWRAARAQLRLAHRRLEGARSRMDAAEEADAAFLERLVAERDRCEAGRASRREAELCLEDARLSAERVAGDGRRWFDRMVRGVLHRAAAASEAGQALAAAAALGGALDDLDSAAQIAVGTLAAARSARELAGRRQEAAAAALAAEGADLSLLTQEGARLESDHAGVRARVGELEARVAVLSEASAGLAFEAANLGDRVAELTREEAGAVDVARAGEALLAGAVDQAARSQRDLDEARAAQGEAERLLDQARSVAQHDATRAAGLRGQIEGSLGGTGAVAEAVARGDLDATRLIERIAIRDPADAPAVEAALEFHLSAWVVEDLVSAAADHLGGDGVRERLLGSGGRVPAPEVLGGGARAALDAVDCDPAVHATLARCLRDVWLLDGIDRARAAVSGTRRIAVLPDGMVVFDGGVHGGGRPGRTLELSAAERDATRAARRARDVVDDLAVAATAAVVRTQRSEEACSAALREVQEARLTNAEVVAAVAAKADALALERRRLESLAGVRATREREQEVAAEALQPARSAERVLADRIEELGRRAEGMRQQFGRLQEEARAAQDDLLAADHDLAGADRAVADLGARRVAAAEALAAARAACQGAQLRLLGAEDEVMLAIVRGDRSRVDGIRAGASVTAAAAALEAVAPELSQAEERLALVEAERAEVAVARARAADEHSAAEAEVGALEPRVMELAEAVRGDRQDEGPEPDAGDAERAEREIVRLERRIAGLGPVNALAPEELARLTTRGGRLRTDRDDLAGACTDILSLMGTLTVEIERRFQDVFDAVSTQFQEVFEELFPGGSASLRLVASGPPEMAAGPGQDPAPAATGATPPGVEIVAQPPGKRLQALSLLSGGERALTALAVILGLQNVSPSPFYIFDEVDAALDDRNVVRFTRLLRRLAVDQQFIVVTHNHVTMAAADALYGVTIDADGVSSILSVRLESDDPGGKAELVGARTVAIRAAV